MAKSIHVEIEPKYPGEPIERMVKRYSKKIKKEGVIAEVLERRYYEKPSVKRRKALKKRKRVLDKLKKTQHHKKNRK
jgi:small subunit ribosomal protein S21